MILNLLKAYRLLYSSRWSLLWIQMRTRMVSVKKYICIRNVKQIRVTAIELANVLIVPFALSSMTPMKASEGPICTKNISSRQINI
jgi:hypothetical protein